MGARVWIERVFLDHWAIPGFGNAIRFRGVHIRAGREGVMKAIGCVLLSMLCGCPVPAQPPPPQPPVLVGDGGTGTPCALLCAKFAAFKCREATEQCVAACRLTRGAHLLHDNTIVCILD